MRSENNTVDRTKRFILWFDEIGMKDVPLVGGKNASLGEMTQQLKSRKIEIPTGFAITTAAYRRFVESNNLQKRIESILEGLDTNDHSNVASRGEDLRKLFLNGEFPLDLKIEISSAYKVLSRNLETKNPQVAVRSSATAEDLEGASFAGQHESILNVMGELSLMKAVKQCFASLFTNRAISYRTDKGFGQMGISLSVGVQQMVRSDLSCSGVMFTIDTESGFDKVIYITASYGVGELIVQGGVSPDQFYVHKELLGNTENPVIEKVLGDKLHKMIYSGKRAELIEVPVPIKERKRYVISDEEATQLAVWALEIEKHYGKAMDIEWAKDGLSGELYIVQARPETVFAIKKEKVYETYILEEKSKILVRGGAVGSKIGQGTVNVLESAIQISDFKKGQVLVTDRTDPDWEPIMKKASAIVTNRGGRTCHAAIVSRELGIPAIVGTVDGTEVLRSGMKVTVDTSEGVGNVYDGLLKFRIEKVNLEEIPETRTKIMMNVAMPENVFFHAQIPNDGVGLSRLEFIIASHIGIHPMALIDYAELSKKAGHGDSEIARIIEAIDERSEGYEDKTRFFVDKLSLGISKIASAFYPKDVIVRLSDFKTNEYAALIGGELYEPKESNPMIGWRGASRYYDEKFRAAFELECQALRTVREQKGLKNVKVMIPFCRTPEEGKKVIEIMKASGLEQGKDGLEIYVMCEIPSNVILADEYSKVFDGFSIGSNDLTQLVLGLDRDSELVSHLYDERNLAVKRMIKNVIEVAKSNGRKIGICGQAPSDFPEFAEFLTECGIDSISLNPDTIVKTRLLVAEKEKALRK
ncbi:MAG TPA: phosphoenolpyruvate synthase [Euryarchaeota archaeon]|nr:phosphoenolpyruvate synthase [Euryarchaeota archaeon]